MAFLLLGCAHRLPGPDTVPALIQEFHQPAEITQVPFYPQKEYQCGPAALTIMLRHQGLNIEPDNLVSEIYLPERHGSFQIEIMASARTHGAVPYQISPNLAALLSEVRAGNPVLVLQNLGLNWFPAWHYAVVVGYDLGEGNIVLRSGEIKRHVISIDLFDKTWRRASYWGIVVLTPEHLPITADADTYFRSLLPFSSTGQWELSIRAHRTALNRWINNKNLLVGLGNAHYSAGDLVEAERVFRQITRAWPDFAPGLNNLAQIVYERGQPREAEMLARKAVAIGGPFKKEFESTLIMIVNGKKSISESD